MKRKILSLVLCGCLVAGMFPAVALAEDSQTTDTTPVVTTETTEEETASSGEWDGFTWSLENDTLTISGEGDMPICSEDGFLKYPWWHLNFSTLIVEKGVTSIARWAFRDCYHLTNVTLPEGITRIEQEAFSFCTGLSSIFLPKSLTSIRYLAFEACDSLETVNYTGTQEQWKSIAVEEQNESLTSATIVYNYVPEVPTSGQCGDNLTWNFDEATKTLTISGTGDMYDYLTPEAENPNAAPWKDLDITTLVVEDGVTSIGWDAFKNIPSLTSVTLPNSIKTMDSAFPFTGLTSVTIPEGVTSINNAFWGCSSLTSVNIPDTVTSMQVAFVECSGLTSIDIPDCVTNINGAFQGCTSLTSVTVPSSVTAMLYAFAGCTSLTTVNIPVSLTTIGEYSFADCTNLTTVNYAGTQAQWEAIDIVESGNDILNSVTVNYTETPVTPTPTPEPTPTPTPAPETQAKVEITVSGDKAEATVGGVTVVLGNAGKVFQDSTTVTVEKITQGAIYDTVKKALEKVVTKMDNTAIFEFTAAKDGKPVQPGGALSVTFNIPKNLSASNLKMFYVSEDGKYEEVKITVDAKTGTVTANLTHFSTYVLANVAPAANDGNGVPQTGDNSALTLYVCVLVMSMAGLTILMANKRRA